MCDYTSKHKSDLIRHSKIHKKFKKLLIDNDTVVNNHTTLLLQSFMEGIGLDPETMKQLSSQAGKDLNVSFIPTTTVSSATDCNPASYVTQSSTLAQIIPQPSPAPAALIFNQSTAVPASVPISPTNTSNIIAQAATMATIQSTVTAVNGDINMTPISTQCVQTDTSLINSNTSSICEMSTGASVAAATTSYTPENLPDDISETDSCSLMNYSPGEIFIVNAGLQFVRFRADIGTKCEVVKDGLAVTEDLPVSPKKPCLIITGDFNMSFKC